MNIPQANIERFDAIASAWDSDPKLVHRSQKVARAMRAALPLTGHERALELGAGTGLVTLVMAPKLAHVTAMDGSAGMLDVLRQKCAQKHLTHIESIVGVVPDALPDARYDLIYSSMTLHHVEDVAGLLKTLAPHVNEGGYVALADLDTEDGSFHGDAVGVAHCGFDRGVFAGWLREAGFADARFSTAVTIHGELQDGTARDYPVFLVVARKPPA